jgi:hypothetical protein
MTTHFDDYKRLEAYMDAVEGNGPQTTLFALLQEAGIDMPALSDRELYTVLWQDTLIQEHPIVPDEFQMMTHIDLLGGWSNEDMRTYLKYYADDQERARFASETNAAIPEHEDPPFRRDHLLPGT